MSGRPGTRADFSFRGSTARTGFSFTARGATAGADFSFTARDATAGTGFSFTARGATARTGFSCGRGSTARTGCSLGTRVRGSTARTGFSLRTLSRGFAEGVRLGVVLGVGVASLAGAVSTGAEGEGVGDGKVSREGGTAYCARRPPRGTSAAARTAKNVKTFFTRRRRATAFWRHRNAAGCSVNTFSRTRKMVLDETEAAH